MLDILDKILELLENKDFPQLGNLLKDMNPADVAELFEDPGRVKRWRLCFACSQRACSGRVRLYEPGRTDGAC